MEEDKKQQLSEEVSDSSVFKGLSPFALPNPFTLESFSVEKWTYMMLFGNYPEGIEYIFELTKRIRHRKMVPRPQGLHLRNRYL